MPEKVFGMLRRANAQRRVRIGTPFALLAAMSVLSGCGGSGGGTTTDARVTISPAEVTIHTGASLAFTATVADVTNQSVTWSLPEGDAGGAITTDGVYTAPATAGTHYVVATSVADPTDFATAIITVQAGSGEVTVN